MLDHGSNSGKRFLKWPPEAILNNLYVNMFCTSWPILMIKISRRGVFRVLHRLERFLFWSEVRIARNSFLLEQLYFYSCWFIIDTGSPWARIGHHAPPTTLHFDQELPGNVVSDVTRNNFEARYGFRPLFLNGRDENLFWAIFPLLNDMESYFCCLHLCFQGQKIDWNQLEKYWVIPIWRIRKHSRWQLVWQNLNVYIANKIWWHVKMLR